MADLVDLVIREAQVQAAQFGGQNVQVVSGHIDVTPKGNPRYRVTSSRTRNHSLHRESIDNCALSAVSRQIQMSEQRSYRFGVSLDLTLGLRESLQLTFSETISIPAYTEVASLQGSAVLSLNLGERIHSEYSETRTYTDNTTLSLPPCTYTEFSFDVIERELAGDVEVDIDAAGYVVVMWSVPIGHGNTASVSASVPIRLSTTAHGTFSGVVAVDVDRDLTQAPCREGLCGALSDKQLWSLWGLSGDPAEPLPEPQPETSGTWFPPETAADCEHSFSVQGVGRGATEAEAREDAQRNADQGAEHQCPIECPKETRIDWLEDFNEPDNNGQWWCFGRGVYTCGRED